MDCFEKIYKDTLCFLFHLLEWTDELKDSFYFFSKKILSDRFIEKQNWKKYFSTETVWKTEYVNKNMAMWAGSLSFTAGLISMHARAWKILWFIYRKLQTILPSWPYLKCEFPCLKKPLTSLDDSDFSNIFAFLCISFETIWDARIFVLKKAFGAGGWDRKERVGFC